MMRQDGVTGEVVRPHTVTEEKLRELDRVRKTIIEQARKKVDPHGIGVDAVMQGTDDGGFFGVTEEEQFQDWLDWADRIANIVSLVSQRISLAVVSVGLAFVGSTLLANERTASLGVAVLAVSGIFVVWFAITMLKGVQSKIQ